MKAIRRGERQDWLDLVLAVGLAGMGTYELLVGGSSEFHNSHGALAVILNIAATLPLALRRRRPALVAAFVAAVLLVQIIVKAGTPFGSVFAFLVISYTVAAHCSREVAGAMLLGIAGVVSQHLTDGGSQIDVGSVIFTYVPMFTAAGAGFFQRNRTARMDALEDDVARAEMRARELAAVAVSDERARIARELHDVVAHKMSVIVLQAGGAARVMKRDPEQAREVLGNIESQGRAALTEMRRLLEVMRVHGEDGPQLMPQPGLQNLPELVADVGKAGLPVRLEVAGQTRPLSPGLDLSAYRIVQEALTNVLKHATGASADVSINYGDREVELVIQNPPGDRKPHPLATSGAGHGLVGMRERVSLFGGKLLAGPHDGGYRVQATLPMEPAQ